MSQKQCSTLKAQGDQRVDMNINKELRCPYYELSEIIMIAYDPITSFKTLVIFLIIDEI